MTPQKPTNAVDPSAVWGVALILLAATAPLYPLLIHGWSEWNTDYTAVQQARRMVWALLYLCMAIQIWRWREAARRVLLAQPVLLFAAAWFAASCLWSPSPLKGGVALVQYAIILVFGGAAAMRLGPLGLLGSIRLMGLVVVAASAVMAVVAPLYAFGQHVNTGALRGIYIEKNHLAQVLSYAFVAALFEAAAAPREGRARLWLGVGAIAAALVAARSSVALGQLLLGGALALSVVGLAGLRYGGWAVGAAALAGLAALGATLPATLAALGEDMTLNGRTELWALLWPHVEARPLIGHGFFGFWSRPEAASIPDVLGWNARGAHNGWITALLTTGVIGAGLWALHWSFIVAAALRTLRPGGDAALAGCGALAIAHLVWSMFEANQLTQMNWQGLIAGAAMALPVWARAGAAARRSAARAVG
ncbi:O-antigen ligase family protein [Oceanicella actignis]|uniref:O-antigen ligase n=1 Tax=Oceanicella actignis TaxID=1189325 RepID=A0A1M7TMZ3_9RHOB|nr:O-antigen ligase family protein [Oceanicella actignis]SET72049.1 O-antigen ligase [Oceanicella actignis]SHN72121.1 O-antigen ligase [Oceanicella actignis]